MRSGRERVEIATPLGQDLSANGGHRCHPPTRQNRVGIRAGDCACGTALRGSGIVIDIHHIGGIQRMVMVPNRRAGLALMRISMVIVKVSRRHVAIIALAMRKAVLFVVLLTTDRCVMVMAVASRCQLTLASVVHAPRMRMYASAGHIKVLHPVVIMRGRLN